MYPIDHFWRAAARTPEAPAVFHPGGVMTYRDLARRVVDVGRAVAAATQGTGRPVGVGGANSVDHLIAILAVLAAGRVWVPLNPRNGDPELARIIDFAAPDLVLGDEALLTRLTGVRPALRAFDTLSVHGARDAAILPMGPDGLAHIPLSDTQAIKFTGGSTGFPKGVKQPFRAWNTNIATQIHELKLTASDRYLVGAPLTHGTSTYMLPLLGSGGALIFPEGSTAGDLLDAAAAQDASVFFAPPTLILSLREEQRRAPRALPRLRLLVYGGAPMRRDHILDTQSVFGPILCTSYGQTEAPQIITFLPPEEMRGDAIASVGRASLMTRIAILDANGAPLPPGADGEIAVHGDLVMTGYLHAEEETQRVLAGGWLRTGDVGTVDDAGYLYIRDRLRDVVITGGFNVYPGDVESVIAGFPAIADCSVVGIADEKWGEALHVAVQLRPGAEFSAAALTAFVRRELGPVKTPKHIHLFEALPRSPVGKTLKTAIRTEIQRRMAPPAGADTTDSAGS